ncbi:hypothetical protein F5148DRAFT_199078 [Russula earlei]|uniref:Uncharacterized protein n=1 Tax=Russula earlei TaxID=71964 RepID=A0ACC0U5U5_9AGAM|nr:hypothetical protein F5148DRAFT_199078 [Russula earlei]
MATWYISWHAAICLSQLAPGPGLEAVDDPVPLVSYGFSHCLHNGGFLQRWGAWNMGARWPGIYRRDSGLWACGRHIWTWTVSISDPPYTCSSTTVPTRKGAIGTIRRHQILRGCVVWLSLLFKFLACHNGTAELAYALQCHVYNGCGAYISHHV